MIFKYVVANTETGKCKLYNIDAVTEYEANNKLVKNLLPFVDRNAVNGYNIADLESVLNDFDYGLFNITKEIDVK